MPTDTIARPLTRYRAGGYGAMVEDEQGPYVRYEDVQVYPDLLAAIKDARDACAALMRAVHFNEDEATADRITSAWADELARIGVANGFGTRADDAIRKAEGGR